MKVLSFVLSLVLMGALLFADEKAVAPKTSPGFEKLKTLAGEWSGKTQEGKPVSISYKVVSNGSAIMEMLNMSEEGEGDMVTMYHQDGDKLMMTHYCGAQNQPRMKAAPATGDVKSLNFSFVDATNLPSANAGHMHHLVVAFQDNDHFTQSWTWREKGKDVHEAVFQFERKK